MKDEGIPIAEKHLQREQYLLEILNIPNQIQTKNITISMSEKIKRSFQTHIYCFNDQGINLIQLLAISSIDASTRSVELRCIITCEWRLDCDYFDADKKMKNNKTKSFWDVEGKGILFKDGNAAYYQSTSLYDQ